MDRSFGPRARRAGAIVLLAATVTAIAVPRSVASPSTERARPSAQPAQPLGAPYRAHLSGRAPGGVPPRTQSAAEAGTGATVAGRSMRVAAGGTSRLPMKDLDIQPGGLGRAEWNRLLDLAQQAGVSVISLDVNWASYEPRRAGAPGEFSELSSFASDVRGRGLLLRFQLVGFPQWARAPGDPSAASQPLRAPASPAELARWSRWVARLVSRFGSAVSYYEIWNEENSSAFWAQGANPTEYAKLLEASYVAAKSVDPAAVVMFGGMSRNDIGFLHATYLSTAKLFPAAAVADHHFFDILGVHPYAGSDSPAAENPNWVYRDRFGEMNGNFLGFRGLHALMARFGEGYKHIYIGEYGLSTTPWNDFPPVSPATQAEGLALAYRLAARAGYVEGFSWYDFFATPWNSAGFSLLKGSYPNWRPTPAYRALANISG